VVKEKSPPLEIERKGGISCGNLAFRGEKERLMYRRKEGGLCGRKGKGELAFSSLIIKKRGICSGGFLGFWRGGKKREGGGAISLLIR